MRYFIELSYFGKQYHGWQVQPVVITVQERLQIALATILRNEINIVGAGRTDTGVHASQMYAHFDVDKKLDNTIIHKLNSVLPDDIVVYRVFPMEEKAHARFDAISRSYEYRIILGKTPFLLDTTWQVHYKELNVGLMNKACAILLDYEDFECFSKVKTDVATFNCSVTNAQWIQEGNSLTFYISANRFLRNMVRSIVGTLVDVGLEKTSLDDFKTIIDSKDRSKAGMSVPAKGLFLTKVEYPYI